MNPASSRSQPNTTTASTASVFKGGITRSNNDRNPFLETPARKLFKHHHHHHDNSLSGLGDSQHQPQQGSTNSPSSAFVRRLSGGNRGNHAFAAGAGAVPTSSSSSSRKPQRLVLTRVMPSTSSSSTTQGSGTESALPTPLSEEPSHLNSFANSSPFTTTVPRATTAPATNEKDSHGFAIPSAPATRPSGKTSQALQQHVQERHSSTTPKVPPNRHYFDLLARSVDSVPAPKLDLGHITAEGKSKEKPQIQGQEEEQEQEQEQERLVEVIPPVNSRMMDFARKSIMQHSAVAPTSIFRKLGNKAGSQQSLTHSQARSLINSNGENRTLSQSPITSNPMTPGTAPVATKTTAPKTIASKAMSPPNRATAESPKEVTMTKESVDRWEPAGDLAFRFVPVPKPTTTPATATSATTAPKPWKSETPAPHEFARSFLDLSGSNQPKIPRKPDMNSVTATSIISNNNAGSSNSFSTSIYPDKAHKPPSMTATLMNISSAMENRIPPLPITTTATATVTTVVDVEMGDAGADSSGDSQRPPPGFDIRAALRMVSLALHFKADVVTLENAIMSQCITTLISFFNLLAGLCEGTVPIA